VKLESQVRVLVGDLDGAAAAERAVGPGLVRDLAAFLLELGRLVLGCKACAGGGVQVAEAVVAA
jgi:hypothetical protein